MHTTQVKTLNDGEWTVHHNGDFSGDMIVIVETYHPHRRPSTAEPRVEFVDNSQQRAKYGRLIHAPDDLMADYYAVNIPFEVMQAIVAAKLRSDMMERLEDMDDSEILASRVKVVLEYGIPSN